MISFTEYLVELMDYKPIFEKVGGLSASVSGLTTYRSVIDDHVYMFSIMIKNGELYFEFYRDDNGRSNFLVTNDVKNPFKVFAAAKHLLKTYTKIYPTYNIVFDGSLSRDKLYKKFAYMIAREVGGTVDIKQMTSQMIVYRIKRDTK